MLIYLDGADLESMARYRDKVDGFTTNPSLMKKCGIKDYREFAYKALNAAHGKPISFEVFADEFDEMERQAGEIASWGDNVYVKIPITNTKGEESYGLIKDLVFSRVQVNVTAVFTAHQARLAIGALLGMNSIVSIFAGRIADTGVDPARTIRSAKAKAAGGTKILWASAREVYNVKQAEEAGADIITLSPDLIAKMDGFGRNLTQYSLETVKQFYADAHGITL